MPRPRVAAAALVALVLIAGCSTPATAPAGTAGASTEPSAGASTVPGSPGATAPNPTGSPGASLSAGPGRIAFARYVAASKTFELFTVNPDGTDVRELIPHNTYAIALPRWSWRGDLLLARASSPTILPTDAVKHIHLFPDSSLDLACSAWAVDASVVACDGVDPAKAGREGVYTIPTSLASLDPFTDEHVDVPAPTRLTTPPKGIHDVPGDYSADGRLAFVRTTYSVLGLGDLWIANADGSDAHRISDTKSTYRIAWSRDGRWIVGERNGVLELFDLQNLAEDPARITIPGGLATEPRFSPDATRIVFVFQKTGAKTTSIETVKLDGTDVVQLTAGELDRSPDWGAPGF